MTTRRPGTCGEPGPRTAHCTEHRLHDYSCCDAGEDTSWNENQWYDFDLAPHDCNDDDCAEQGYRGPPGRESEYDAEADDAAVEQDPAPEVVSAGHLGEQGPLLRDATGVIDVDGTRLSTDGIWLRDGFFIPADGSPARWVMDMPLLWDGDQA